MCGSVRGKVVVDAALAEFWYIFVFLGQCSHNPKLGAAFLFFSEPVASHV